MVRLQTHHFQMLTKTRYFCSRLILIHFVANSYFKKFDFHNSKTRYLWQISSVSWQLIQSGTWISVKLVCKNPLGVFTGWRMFFYALKKRTKDRSCLGTVVPSCSCWSSSLTRRLTCSWLCLATGAAPSIRVAPPLLQGAWRAFYCALLRVQLVLLLLSWEVPDALFTVPCNVLYLYFFIAQFTSLLPYHDEYL